MDLFQICYSLYCCITSGILQEFGIRWFPITSRILQEIDIRWLPINSGILQEIDIRWLRINSGILQEIGIRWFPINSGILQEIGIRWLQRANIRQAAPRLSRLSSSSTLRYTLRTLSARTPL